MTLADGSPTASINHLFTILEISYIDYIYMHNNYSKIPNVLQHVFHFGVAQRRDQISSRKEKNLLWNVIKDLDVIRFLDMSKYCSADLFMEVVDAMREKGCVGTVKRSTAA